MLERALARALRVLTLGVRSILVACVALLCLAVLGASGWSWSVVSWLIGAGFGLAALLLPGRIAAGVCFAIGAAVLAPALSRGDDATQLVMLVAELGVAAIFAVAVRTSVVTLRRHETVVRDRNQDLANVHEAGQRLTRTMTSDDLCREVARATRGITGASYARLVVTSPDGRRIVLVAASGHDGETVVSGPRAPEFEEGGSRGLALESGEPVRIGPEAPSPVAVPAWYPVAPTYLVVPIVVDGERRGELVAAGKASGSFTPICQMLLSIYAVEASAALKGALLGEAVDEALEAATMERNRSGIVSGHNEAVLEIAKRLTETLDRKTILQTIVRELNHELATDAATIRILEGEELRVAAWAGMTDAEARVLPRFRHDEGWFAEVIGSGKVWSCADLRVERLFSESFSRYAGQIDWCGDIVAPLTHGGRVIGAVSAVTRAPRQWTQEDVDFVSAIAAQASIAIHNAELFEKSEGLARELRGLVAMSSDLAGTLDSAHVADRIAYHLAVATDVPSCRISYLDRDTNRLVALGHYPAATTWAFSGGDPLDGPAARRALAEQIAMDAVARHEPTGPRVHLGLLPLVAKGESIGLVELASDRTEPLDRGRLALARTMANEAAIALENARLYEIARNQADRDQLTGFFNHRFFHQRLGEEVVRAQRGRVPLGLLMLDIDDFKLVNDTFGHLLGDRVLHWAAEVIRSALRLSDIPARYGGDEFAVLLPDADLAAAEVVADRIRAAFYERSFPLDGGGPLPIALSIGAASFPSDARGGQALIGVADRALYRGKQAGAPAAPKRPRQRTARGAPAATKATAAGAADSE